MKARTFSVVGLLLLAGWVQGQNAASRKDLASQKARSDSAGRTTVASSAEIGNAKPGAGASATGTASTPPPLAFKPPVPYGSGASFGNFVVAADVNGDHKLDLLVGNTCVGPNDCSTGSVAVLLGNGNGTFQPAVVYPSGGPTESSHIAVGDVNGDGALDLILPNCVTQTNPFCMGPDGAISVLLGNGDGTFQPAVNYSTGTPTPWSVALADLNGDKKLDLVVANRGTSTVHGALSVLLGNGDGTFQPPRVFGIGPAVSVSVADLNGDHKPDLVAAFLGGDVEVWLGNGDGTFRPPSQYMTGGQDAWSVAIADLNGDGKLDLAVANACPLSECTPTTQGSVGILLGNGDGTFRPAVAYPSGGTGAVSITIADLNGDLVPDLAVANAGNSSQTNVGAVAVLAGVGDGTFLPAVTFSSKQAGATAVTTADLNGDGRLDLAATTSCLGHTATCEGGVSVFLKSIGSSQAHLSTSASPVFVGQSVTFTATVSSSFAPIPDGESVTFYDGAAILASVPLATGSATYTTSALSAKTHTIKVTYAGDYNLKSSSSGVSQIIQKYPTTTAVTSTPNPSHPAQIVTFTVQVKSAGSAPSGRVQIRDGSTLIATISLANGTGTFSTTKLAVGTHSITATYLGDANTDKSTSATLTQVVQ
jgi:hypothetical protein